jgi:oxaloacetate decarboxylase gamma subunit
MTIVQMLEQSGVLTLLGMGIVFGFLIILVISVSLTGKVIRSLGMNKDAGAAPGPTSPGPSRVAKTTAVTAAISAAVTEYRKEKDGKK